MSSVSELKNCCTPAGEWGRWGGGTGGGGGDDGGGKMGRYGEGGDKEMGVTVVFPVSWSV